nr:unnamed protein product [Callosobruchus analis]
MIVLHLP